MIGKLRGVRDPQTVTWREHSRAVWTVHVTMPDEVRPTEAAFSDEQAANAWAQQLSTEPGVLAASVIRFVLDEPGNRRNVSMFVRGGRQAVPHISDCRRIHGGGRPHTGTRSPNA